LILRFIIAIVALTLVGGAIVGFNLFRDSAIEQFFASMQPPASTVSTITVEPGPWTPGIETIGTVSAAQGVDLTVETAGVVSAILFKANGRVAKGDVLLQLDDAVQQADLAAAKAQAALDQQALDRALELQRRKVGSDVAVDSAQAAASASAAQVQKLQALVEQKKILAPFAGTIGIPQIDIGQYLSPGTKVATLQDIDTLRADFAIPEQRLGELTIGQPVTFGFGTGDMPFKGAITGIDPKVDPNSRLVSVRASIDNPDGKLTPGQFVEVRVILPTEENVVSVPQTSLVSSLYGDFVYVVRPAPPPPAPPAGAAPAATPAPAADAAAPAAAPAPEKLIAAQIFVKPGRRADGHVEITTGLKGGDQVVTAGQNRLFNGSPVVIDNSVDPSKAEAAE
jgi:membrane fusion protein (multidrug efflux system)